MRAFMRWQSVNANAEKKTVEFDFTDISADEEADYAEVKSSFDNGLQHPSLPEATSHPQPKKKPSRKRKNVVIQGSGANQEQNQAHDKKKRSRPKNKTLGTQQRKQNKDCFDDDFLSLDFIVHTKATTNDKEQADPQAKANDNDKEQNNPKAKANDNLHDNSHDKGTTPPINIVVDRISNECHKEKVHCKRFQVIDNVVKKNSAVAFAVQGLVPCCVCKQNTFSGQSQPQKTTD